MQLRSGEGMLASANNARAQVCASRGTAAVACALARTSRAGVVLRRSAAPE